MRYLIDTHILLWMIFSPEKLNPKSSKILYDGNSLIYVSPITIWEISLKFEKGKLLMENLNPENLPQICRTLDLEILPLHAIDCATLFKLSANFHKDPFDRMLIWQCIQNDFTFISDDKDAKKYTTIGLKILS